MRTLEETRPKMDCDNCKEEVKHLKGAVLNNTFGFYCTPCLSGESRQAGAHQASEIRTSDRDAHQRDIIQPYKPDGTPNSEFISEYPDQAKDYFSQEQLEKYA